LALIRIGICHGHIALITKEYVYARPVDSLRGEVFTLLLCRKIQPSKLMENPDSCTATGEDNTRNAIVVEAATCRLNAGYGIDEFECGL